jgi:hypothetical protein
LRLGKRHVSIIHNVGLALNGLGRGLTSCERQPNKHQHHEQPIHVLHLDISFQITLCVITEQINFEYLIASNLGSEPSRQCRAIARWSFRPVAGVDPFPHLTSMDRTVGGGFKAQFDFSIADFEHRDP